MDPTHPDHEIFEQHAVAMPSVSPLQRSLVYHYKVESGYLPPDTSVDVFGTTFTFHSGALGPYCKLYGSLEEETPIEGPGSTHNITHQFTARELPGQVPGWGLYPVNMSNPPGEYRQWRDGPHPEAHLFKRYLDAAYWRLQGFKDMKEVRQVYNIAVWFGRYLWFGEYLGICLQQEENLHIMTNLDSGDVLENLKMAENLQVAWLFEELMVHLVGQMIRWSNQQRTLMFLELSPRTYQLVWKVFFRSRRGIRQVQALGKLIYHEMHHFQESQSQLIFYHSRQHLMQQFRPFLMRPFTDQDNTGQADDVWWLKEYKKFILKLKSSGLPVISVAPINATRIEEILKSIDSLLKTRAVNQDRTFYYVTQGLLPTDLFPWESNEQWGLGKRPRAQRDHALRAKVKTSFTEHVETEVVTHFDTQVSCKKGNMDVPAGDIPLD